MKTFPLNNDYESEFRSFNEKMDIPVFDWGKKIFYFDTDRLRAIIPVATCIGMTDNKRTMETVLVCKMAGYPDIRYIPTNKAKFFKTKEDYLKSLTADIEKRSDNNQLTIENINLKDLIEKAGIKTCRESGSGCNVIIPKYAFCNYPRYKVIEVGIPIKAFWVDEEGTHVKIDDTEPSIDGRTVYTTIDECIKANITIVDFDD